MIVHDLGTLSGPVLMFGGPYSNLQASQALIAEAERRAIPPSHVICTGDVVAYCADAFASAEAIRAFGCAVVAGNMEKQLGAGATDCGCGFEDGTACDLMSGAWFAHAAAQITPDQRAWMAACPDVVTFTHEGRRCAVIHGGVTDVSRFLWPTSPDTEFLEEWEALETVVGPVDVILSGHSGIPFERDLPNGTWINAGVIGMPAHDGDAATVFALLDQRIDHSPRTAPSVRGLASGHQTATKFTGPGSAVTFHRLTYDQDAACAAMEAVGLVQGYHRGLVTGYWPSEDVLPDPLKLASRAKG